MAADLQAAKAAVRDFHAALDAAADDQLEVVLTANTTTDWSWRGMHPFYEQNGAAAVADVFWKPLRTAMRPIQRRADVFFAGRNTLHDEAMLDEAMLDEAMHDAVPGTNGAGGVDEYGATGDIWVVQMGHLLGLFDAPWLAIPPTGRMCFLRYVEFNRVLADGKIAETSLFVDIPSVMRQAGHNPFPPQTGSSHIYPGPQTHDGLLHVEQDPAEGRKTMALVNEMIGDLSEANRIANETGVDTIPVEVMAKSWASDMIWSGPEGIGASYTIERYQQQHSYPFRFNLTDKVFNGHITRFAEGNYACFFGWANLTNRPTGGFLGMPASTAADMRVVDVYRRNGDKLAENWVIIDLLHWLSMQGLDVLARMRQLTGQEQFGDLP